MKKPLSSINLNSANHSADQGVRFASSISFFPGLPSFSSTHARCPPALARSLARRHQKKPSSISLLQPLYKNQNYMIPQKALDVSQRATTPRPAAGARAQLSNALADLTKLAVPARKEERAAIRGDLLKIIDVCQRKLAACTADFSAEDR